MENRFPWLPTIAPLVTSGILWAVTGSALSLLFGVMSPVLLVASYVEGRLNTRRRRARESERERQSHVRDTARLESELRARTAEAHRAHPPASQLISLVPVARLPIDHHDPGRRAGVQAGAEYLGGDLTSDDPIATIEPRIRIGTDDAGLPVLIGLRDGLHIVGDVRARRSLVRAITAHVWWFTGDCESMIPSLLAHGDEVGAEARWRVNVQSDDSASLLDRDCPAVPARTIRPELLSPEGLSQLRVVLIERGRARHARNSTTASVGLDVADQAKALDPSVVAFDVEVGLTRSGKPFHLNLLESGAHMVVSGTTGSGKTTFLVNWLSRLAEQCDASTLELAIIDFKGGIDFSDLESWPHCVGFATDLDEGAIDRALVGLEVEMSRREHVLRSGRSRADLSHLVVILDEFRATSVAHPRAVSVVVDIAARGRALGVHLVLSTQRASSSISEDILANVALRVAFRTLTPRESVFLIGDASAHRALRQPGHAVVSHMGASPTIVHMSPPRTRGESPATVLASPGRPDVSVRRVWTPPLPAKISRDVAQLFPRLAPPGNPNGSPGDETPRDVELCVGVVDALTRQRWESAWYRPHEEGQLLITGPARSGRTSTLRSLALAMRESEPASRWEAHLIDDVMDMWDWLDTRCRDRGLPRSESTSTHRDMVFLDGLERMMSLLEPDVRDVLSERLMAKMRDAGGDRIVVACDADGPWATRLSSVCAQRLRLVSSELPGRAHWKGDVVHVPFHEENAHDWSRVQFDESGTARIRQPIDTRVVEISARGSIAETLDDRAGTFVARASAAEWGERLHEFLTLTRNAAILVNGRISPADARLLLRPHTPVPPVSDGEGILLLPDGGYHRLRGGITSGRYPT